MSENNNPRNRRSVFEEDQPNNYRFYDQEPFDSYSNVTTPLSAANRGHLPGHPQITDKEEKQLDQLALGFKIYAGIQGLFACIPFIHLFIGIMMVTGGFGNDKNGPPPAFGWMFIIMAVIFITLGWAIAICNYYAGKFIKERRNYIYCFVMSCIDCTFMPFGTILGIFGIILLLRDQIKEAFNNNLKEIR